MNAFNINRSDDAARGSQNRSGGNARFGVESVARDMRVQARQRRHLFFNSPMAGRQRLQWLIKSGRRIPEIHVGTLARSVIGRLKKGQGMSRISARHCCAWWPKRWPSDGTTDQEIAVGAITIRQSERRRTPVSTLFHRVEKLCVVFCCFEFIDQKFGRFELIHAVHHFA